MLKTMRASFHHLKWTLFVVIIVFVLGFVFFSGSGSDGSGNGGQIVARMGKEEISAVEFDRIYQNQVQRYREMYKGSFSPELARALDLPRQVLEGMIERKLRIEAARRMNLRVTDAELARSIAALPFFQASSSARKSTPSGSGSPECCRRTSRKGCARTSSSTSTPLS
jgi:peptidyl-prolyl cis-trans isomerase D